MRWGVVATLVCFLVGIEAQARFTTSTGIEADPCNNGVINNPAACPSAARGGMSTTIMLPAADSASLAVTHPRIFAGTETMTLNGFDITADLAFYLSGNGADCTTAAAGIATQNCAGNACTRGANGQTITFTIPTAQNGNCGGQACWNDVALLASRQALGTEQPRLLCAAPIGSAPTPGNAVPGGFWTGLRIGTRWNCVNAVNNPNSSQRCSLFTPTGNAYNLYRPEQLRVLRAATQCCQSTIGFNVGTCINPSHQSCCGVPQNRNERCCSATRQIVQPYNQACPCSSTGGDADCPTGERCCLPYKYEEFRDITTASGVVAGINTGVCYNRNTSRCCDTGSVYDPGAQQCCSVNGVQSLNIPCPCDTDEDCIGGQREYQHSIRDFRCCRQTDPEPIERARDQHGLITANGQTVSIAKYANFPSGTGLYNQQRCAGSCIDVRFQICCNGVACVREFERCCNNTCCNRFTESCEFGYRAPTTGNQFNYIDFKVEYYQCTRIEAMNPVKAFWIYILPTALLIATAIAFGIVMIFANKAANRSYSTLERAILAVATLITLLALFLFFSPAYKYGLVAIFAALIGILAAAARIRWLNIVALIAVGIALLYVFDPFPANNILGFSSYRFTEDDLLVAVDDDGEVGSPNIRTMGLLHTVDLMNRDDQRFCVDYYDYFRFDPELRDEERCDNPEVQSFGYCDRGFIFILLLASALLMILLLLLFILLILALFLRFIKAPPAAPLELEVVPEPEPVVMPPPMVAPIVAPMVVEPLAPMVAPMVAPMAAPLSPIAGGFGITPGF